MHNYFDVQAIRAFGQSKYFDAHMDEVEQGLKLQKRIRLRREYFAKHVSQDGQQADELELNEIEQQELDLAIAKLLGVESKLHDGRRRYINQFLFAPGFEGKFSTGFHQVFPIIVQCVKMKAGEILALENPEVHLHPDLQLKFAEYLLEQSKVGKRIMIETHSDLIIRRMMRAVLAEEVPQNHISLNFCRMQKLDNGITTAVVEPYGVDANGRIRWPEGFMDESIAESDRLLEVMYAMRKRRDGGDE